MGARSLIGIFKAYDVRGLVPDDLDEDAARRIGAAFAAWSGAPRIAIGRDCRISSPDLAAALADGMTGAGADVVDLGLASTDLVYFAAGSLDVPAVMLTASHNPPRWNGMKFCLGGARPVGEETGLAEIRRLAESADPPQAVARGTVASRDLLDAYVDHVLTFVDAAAMRPLTVVADTANGMGGLVLPAVAERLPIDLIHLFPDLDGTFPNHPADPIDPANQVDVREGVIEHGADIGLAFDGDADRVFVVDEQGEGVSGSEITALVARAMLERHPGSTVVHNVITSWTVPEVVRESGGNPVRTRVGHSFIKQVMADTDAVFGGEHSGHYYFRDNYRADSGLIAAVVVLEQLSRAGAPLSAVVEPFRRYFASGEINSRVDDLPAAMARVEAALPGGRIDRLDGVTIAFDDWWCNVRPSNTEPLLRLNVEARSHALLAERTTELLALIRGDEGGRL
ncbi:MAG: phosphomannomutase/phosphoglucomutase [Actinomycetota bacterium]